jgi:hypothetical protein
MSKIEGQQGINHSLNLYHDRLQNELKEKNEALKAEEKHDLFANKQEQTDTKNPLEENSDLKDKIVLSAIDWEDTLKKMVKY